MDPLHPYSTSDGGEPAWLTADGWAYQPAVGGEPVVVAGQPAAGGDPLAPYTTSQPLPATSSYPQAERAPDSTPHQGVGGEPAIEGSHWRSSAGWFPARSPLAARPPRGAAARALAATTKFATTSLAVGSSILRPPRISLQRHLRMSTTRNASAHVTRGNFWWNKGSPPNQATLALKRGSTDMNSMFEKLGQHPPSASRWQRLVTTKPGNFGLEAWVHRYEFHVQKAWSASACRWQRFGMGII